jgi:predicted transcriptional regulator
MSDKTTLHARIDKEHLEKLQRIAESEKRTLSNLIRKILLEYLARKP